MKLKIQVIIALAIKDLYGSEAYNDYFQLQFYNCKERDANNFHKRWNEIEAKLKRKHYV